MLELGLDGKHAFVAGVGGGIGGACVRALAAAGADVTCFDLDAATATEAARSTGARGLALSGDARRLDDVQLAIDTAAAALGPIDIAVDVIGEARWGRTVELDDAAWDESFDLVLRRCPDTTRRGRDEPGAKSSLRHPFRSGGSPRPTTSRMPSPSSPRISLRTSPVRRSWSTAVPPPSSRSRCARDRPVVASNEVRQHAVRLLVVGLAVSAIASCSASSKPDAASTSSTSASSAPASPTTTTEPRIDHVTRTGQQRLSPLYGQGVARVPGGWIFSGTNSLWRTDDALRVVKMIAPAIPDAWKAKGFNHVGDIDVVGRYIYAPLEEPDYSKGHQATARYDRVTLKFVDAVMLPQHENSFVSVDPTTMIAYTQDRFDGDTLLRYDVAHRWKPLSQLRMSRVLHRTQGGDVAHGAIWISTDDAQRGVYRVDLKTGAVIAVAEMGHEGGEGEGIDATDLPSGFLHALCIDKAFAPVWFEHFRASGS